MKKIYLPLFAFSLVSSLNAQHTITTSNLPAVGDTYKYFAVNSSGVSTGTTGTGQTWNYSTLVPLLPVGQMNYVAPSTTPMAADFPNSTLAENDSSNYAFYRLVGGTSWQMDGLEITASGITARAVFTDQAVKYNAFPYGYGSTTPSDAITGNISSGLTGTLTGTNNTTCDGSGTLILPAGTFTNCIRIRDSLHFSFTLTAPLPTTGSYYQTRYSYYHSSSKFPLLEIRISYINTALGGTTTVKEVYINESMYVGMYEQKDAVSFNLFPNPAKDELNININLPKQHEASVEVINQLGQVIKSEKPGTEISGVLSWKIDVSKLSAGVYFVRVKNRGAVKVEKFIVE